MPDQQEFEQLESDAKDVVVNSTQSDHAVEVESIIKRHAMFAAGAGMIPVPILDAVAVAGIQYKLAESLCQEYGVPFEPYRVKVILSSALTSLLSSLAANGIQAAAGGISIPGIIGGNITNAAVSGYLTFATGEILRLHFATGGTLEDLELGHYLDFFESQFKEGKLRPKNFTSLSAFGYLM